MDHAGSVAYPVFIGVWTNWSHGPVYGSTLTLKREHGGLLIAFVAFFITVVGTRFWRILSLILYLAYSSDGHLDALYHQRQAILRNSPSPEMGLLNLWQLIWAWRHAESRRYRRIMPLLTTAAICGAGFTVASGFSSMVSSTVGGEVLLSGSGCARLIPPPGNTTKESMLSDFNPFLAKMIASSDTYAQQCYNSEPSSETLNCGMFIQKALPNLVTANASCPFGGNLCRNNNSNLVMDSGFLDIHDHFGLNTPPNERFTYRKVISCAPLQLEGYTSQYQVSSTSSYTRYSYGQATGRISSPWSYQYTNDAEAQRAATNQSSLQPDYSLGLLQAKFANGTLREAESSFRPLPELIRPDGDLSVYFLSGNAIHHITPQNDPWYKATTPVDSLFAGGQYGNAQNVTMYRQDEAASPLACIEQQQVCNPNGGGGAPRCTPLLSAADIEAKAPALFQGPVLDRFRWASLGVLTNSPQFPYGVRVQGANALTSRRSLNMGFSGRLPNNQWQLDMLHLSQLFLATLQAQFIYLATGHSDPGTQKWMVGPEDDAQRRFCQAQKITSTAYTSFSILGLSIIVAVGFIIIAIGLIPDNIMFGMPARSTSALRAKAEYARLEWCTNETLQLQRLVHEELGLGTWSGATHTVPVTQTGELLGKLDVGDGSHPKLRPPLRTPGSGAGGRWTGGSDEGRWHESCEGELADDKEIKI